VTITGAPAGEGFSLCSSTPPAALLTNDRHASSTGPTMRPRHPDATRRYLLRLRAPVHRLRVRARHAAEGRRLRSRRIPADRLDREAAALI
jgi:hypothetical protein